MVVVVAAVVGIEGVDKNGDVTTGAVVSGGDRYG